MTATDVVLGRLAQITALSSLVGGRQYALKLPQSATFPAVLVSLISQVATAHLRGVAVTFRARVQVDAIARDASGIDPLAQAQAIASAAHGVFANGEATGLAGWRGDLGSPAVRVSAMMPMQRREGYFADDLRQVVVSQDYDVWFDGL